MKRRDFLKSIGIGAVACVVPSEAIVPKQEMTFKSDKDWGEVTDVAIVDEKGSTLFEEAIEDMVKTPESLYLALFTSELDEDGIGDEVSYNGYKRQPIALETDKNIVFITEEIAFPEFNDDSLIVTSIGIFSGENMLLYENLTSSVLLTKATTVKFPRDYINMRMD